MHFYTLKFKCLLGLFVSGGDFLPEKVAVKMIGPDGGCLDQKHVKMIERRMTDFASRQLYLMDLTKTYNYWVRECKFKDKDNVWTNTTLGAFISAYESVFLINKRETNAFSTSSLHIMTYDKANNYFLSKFFSSFGFKGFKIAIVDQAGDATVLPVAAFGD